MKYKRLLKIAYTALITNKSRAGLTILGVVIGIASIMLVVSIGRGAEALILNEISGLGSETVVIRPGKEPEGPTDFADTLYSHSLTERDFQALQNRSNVPHLVSISPAFFIPGGVSFQGETFNTPTILGISAEFFSGTFNIFPEEGAVFTDEDIQNRASITVIGEEVKDELFGESDAIGEFIQIRGRKFRVVGVFPKKGQVAFFNVDELVLVPPTTAQTYILGISHYHEFITKVDDPDNVPKTVADIEATLRANHGIEDPDDDDFFVETQQALVDQIKVIVGALTAMLSSIVAIALVVAGVGLMNIILVSVTERTREIGLRKSLGAREKDILWQFLIEAVLLTSVGGVIGIILGTGLAFVASIILTNVVGIEWTFIFPWSATFIAVLVSVGVGLVFGVYPARVAAKKNPIEALRYE